MSFIQLNNIVKTFNDSQRQTETLAIDDISLSFEKKEFACLLGPSGCGKSTLLNMVAGFEYPTLGSVKRKQSHYRAWRRSRHGISTT